MSELQVHFLEVGMCEAGLAKRGVFWEHMRLNAGLVGLLDGSSYN